MTKTKHVLNVQSRSLTGSANARRLRKQGLIPAVIYSKGAEPETVAVDAGEWEILTRGELNLISLKEGEKTQLVLLQEVQHDFIRNCASHIDFMAVKNDMPVMLLPQVSLPAVSSNRTCTKSKSNARPIPSRNTSKRMSLLSASVPSSMSAKSLSPKVSEWSPRANWSHSLLPIRTVPLMLRQLPVLLNLK